MLLKLSISNFAIIRSLVFEPSASLNIITGETGAGKSIILDALGLILGGRADMKMNNTGSGEKCIVEGVFRLDPSKYKTLFEELELDFEEETIIRREITDIGKSRSFINDTPASLAQIKAVTGGLISIHSQHENTHLTEREFQFNLLDAYAGQLPAVAAFRQAYHTYKKSQSRLQSLKEQQQNLLKEKDYLQYLLSEFETARLEDNEEESLENELKLLTHAETIEHVAGSLIMALEEGEGAVADILKQLRSQLKTIAEVSPLSKELYSRLDSAIIELKDIASEADDLRQSATPDPKRLEEVNERLLLIQNLKRKHGVAEYNELQQEEQRLAGQLLAIGNIDMDIEVLKAETEKQEAALKDMAGKLHATRVKNAGKIEQAVKHLLVELEMPKADIRFDLKAKPEFDESGNTELNILFTANVGMPLQLLSKVASGGELSRLALCFRSIEAEHSDLSTLIFDEIDTGVSGKVADTIGSLFDKLSENRQVIAVTHLPQVASYGDAHFMIAKREEDHKTVSYLKKLNKAGRVDELAKMLSGNTATDIARKNALELLKN